MKPAVVIYYLFMILVVAGLCYLGWYMVENKEAYFDNPFVYGASRMGNVECSCYQNKGYGRVAYFNFNDTDFWNDERTTVKVKTDGFTYELNVTAVQDSIEIVE